MKRKTKRQILHRQSFNTFILNLFGCEIRIGQMKCNKCFHLVLLFSADLLYALGIKRLINCSNLLIGFL